MPAPAPKPTDIPQSPGVYCFRDARGGVLYVGKAANLRQRIGSYFQPGANLSPAKRRLLDEAAAVTWEELGSEIEALLREAHDIKKYQPPYNVLLRDDKTYLSVKIAKEEFPRVIATRKIESDGSTYFGPFTDARAVKETLKVLRRLFPYRTNCKPNAGRLCLDAHLGLCPGVCAGKISAREYELNIKRIKLFFLGKRPALIAALKREARMLKKSPHETDIAKAAKPEAQAHFLEKVIEMQHVLSFGEKAEGDVHELAEALHLKKAPKRIEGYDVSNIMGTLATGSMVVFTDGVADKGEYKRFKIKTVRGANDVAMLKEVLRRRFAHSATISHQLAAGSIVGPSSKADGQSRRLPAASRKLPPAWPLPDLVVIDGGRPQLSATLEVWRELKLTIPLVSLAKRYEEIFTPASPDPLVLPRTSGALHLLERVRDEAHRFAVSYHKLLRRQRLLGK